VQSSFTEVNFENNIRRYMIMFQILETPPDARTHAYTHTHTDTHIAQFGRQGKPEGRNDNMIQPAASATALHRWAGRGNVRK